MLCGQDASFTAWDAPSVGRSQKNHPAKNWGRTEALMKIWAFENYKSSHFYTAAHLT